MTSADSSNWTDANQRYLTAALVRVRAALERHAQGPSESRKGESPEAEAEKRLQAATGAMPGPPALETLGKVFGLSPFERDILLLCAGVELEAAFAPLCAAAQGDPQRNYPTFGLALAALPDAHWSALTPAGPLRTWRLIEVGAGHALTLSPLRIDECILHYLAGAPHPDERLAGLVEPVPMAGELTPSYQELAEQVAAIWSRAVGNGRLPVVQLCGPEGAAPWAIGAAATAMLRLNLSRMWARALPLDPRELETLLRLWEREAALRAAALLLDCGELETGDAGREEAIARVVRGVRGPLLVTGRERRSHSSRTVVTLEVDKPTAEEQQTLWHKALAHTDPARLNGQIERLVSQFHLSAPAIEAVCAEAAGRKGFGTGDQGSGTRGPIPNPSNDLGTELWDICRVQARPRLDALAQRIEPVATWDHIVLPEGQVRILREIAAQVRQRRKVYETWGFTAMSSRGLGITTLFAGPSGTGKTMAAEVLANELRLDLYHIDLSQVVSKYIGETEKNLRRVFDAAEGGGAILLFDEADALFGKRTEIKDSHDRYANIEISYLLQRMEAFRGLAILTTNRKDALDDAFLRRIRFIVQFPFPDAAQRADIWRGIYPKETPRAHLDVGKLARLNVAGANIRNIALNAAFLAADTEEPVRMTHLLRAARSEYAKLEKTLTELEVGGWEK
jgi:hypothetical protein